MTWVNDLANLAVGESNIMRQAGSELFNQRGGMGDFFFKRMVAYPGRPDLRVDGNFETLITELNISIPAYADHFIDFKFQNIPVHRITENYNASTHDLTYLPQNGCFDGMWEHSDFNDQGYVMGGDIFRFDTSAHPSQWWNQDMWMVPKY